MFPVGMTRFYLVTQWLVNQRYRQESIEVRRRDVASREILGLQFPVAELVHGRAGIAHCRDLVSIDLLPDITRSLDDGIDHDLAQELPVLRPSCYESFGQPHVLAADDGIFRDLEAKLAPRGM